MLKLLLLVSILLTNSVVYSGSQSPVVVLLSDDTSAYTQPMESFTSTIKHKVITYNLHGDINKAPSTLQKIINDEPALIFALGAKAAFFAKAATKQRQDIPVIFSMVLNWQRLNLMDGQKNVVGIDNGVAPSTMLFSFGLLFPEVKRIGMFYSKSNSASMLKELKDAAKGIGVDIISEQIDEAKQLKQAYKKMAGNVDALWIPADPVLYTLENTHWLNRNCLKDRMICIGHSDNIAKLGLTLSINPDISSIGSQASQIAIQILQYGKSPANIGMQPPLGTNVTLNARTAKKIGIEIPDFAVQIADKVIQ